MSSKGAPPRAGSLSKQEFCQACGRYATGVTILTAIGSDGAPHGMTANSFTSVSINPLLVLVCVDHTARILDYFRATKHLGINVLAEFQQELSVRFARRGHDRFDGVEWYPGVTGAPLLPGALASLECAVTRTLDAGDHAILIAEVLHAECREGRPLVYFNSSYRKLAE